MLKIKKRKDKIHDIPCSLALIRNSEVPLYCWICDATYVTEIFHSNEKLCPTCEKIFAGKDIRDGHFVDPELDRLFKALQSRI